MARHEKQEQDYTKNPEQKVGPSHPRENSSLGIFSEVIGLFNEHFLMKNQHF